MAKNIVVRKKVGDKWVELHPATNGGNVALADGKTVQAKMNEMKIRTYASISDIGIERGQESSLKQIVDAMVEHSKMSESIWYDKSFYPTTNGTIVIDKVDAGRVMLFFIGAVGTGHLWQASYDQNSFSGWRRVITENEVSNGNLLINGDFQIWQDGEVFTDNGYTADGWILEKSPQAVVNLQREATGILLFSQTGAYSSNIDQIIEGDYKNLKGKHVTLSIELETTSEMGMSIQDDRVSFASRSIPITSGVQKFSVSGVIPTSIQPNHLRVFLFFNNTEGMARVLNAKLEVGEIETPFVPRTYAEELALCKRYFQKSEYTPQGGSSINWMGYTDGAIEVTQSKRFDVTMRVTPTMTLSDMYNSNFDNGVVLKEATVEGIICGKNSSGAGMGRFIVAYRADARL